MYIYLILYILCKHVFKSKDYDISCRKDSSLVHDIYKSWLLSWHQYVVYETTTNVQTYISCACATIIWQVWIDFFLRYSMHSIFTVYHDGWKLDKYVPWITENGSSKSKYNMWCVLYAGYSADFSRLLWISYALGNVCWLIL